MRNYDIDTDADGLCKGRNRCASLLGRVDVASHEHRTFEI